MTNAIALFLGILLIGFFATDAIVYEWDMTNFTIRKFIALIEYLAVWR